MTGARWMDLITIQWWWVHYWKSWRTRLGKIIHVVPRSWCQLNGTYSIIFLRKYFHISLLSKAVWKWSMVGFYICWSSKLGEWEKHAFPELPQVFSSTLSIHNISNKNKHPITLQRAEPWTQRRNKKLYEFVTFIPTYFPGVLKLSGHHFLFMANLTKDMD